MHKITFIILVLVTFSCHENEIKHSGICLSFDDRTVKEWYAIKDLLKKYNSHVTFFITQFDSLDSTEIRMLRELENEGHEIGSHGALHVISENYIKENSYEEYIKNEINANSLAMKKNGFFPKSFAYPYGAKYWFTDMLLLKKFKILRGVGTINNKRDLTLIDDIYYSFDGDRTLAAIGIDQGVGLTKEMIKNAIKRASVNHELLMLYGHSPITKTDDGPYNFNIDLLEFILNEAKENHLKYFKYGELGSRD